MTTAATGRLFFTECTWKGVLGQGMEIIKAKNWIGRLQMCRFVLIGKTQEVFEKTEVTGHEYGGR